jgi:hypothetical protein
MRCGLDGPMTLFRRWRNGKHIQKILSFSTDVNDWFVSSGTTEILRTGEPSRGRSVAAKLKATPARHTSHKRQETRDTQDAGVWGWGSVVMPMKVKSTTSRFSPVL